MTGCATRRCLPAWQSVSSRPSSCVVDGMRSSRVPWDMRHRETQCIPSKMFSLLSRINFDIFWYTHTQQPRADCRDICTLWRIKEALMVFQQPFKVVFFTFRLLVAGRQRILRNVITSIVDAEFGFQKSGPCSGDPHRSRYLTSAKFGVYFGAKLLSSSRYSHVWEALGCWIYSHVHWSKNLLSIREDVVCSNWWFDSFVL